MPKYSFTYWEETKWGVVFEADNLEHAKQLLEEELNVDDLPNVEKFFKKGDETWVTDTLQEEKETKTCVGENCEEQLDKDIWVEESGMCIECSNAYYTHEEDEMEITND